MSKMLDDVRAQYLAKQKLYSVAYRCNNCTRRFELVLPKGQAAPDCDAKCPQCDCSNSHKIAPPGAEND